jgi:peptidoglycan/xylan/chitin deacetylase (PgdA/CDA1 family)
MMNSVIGRIAIETASRLRSGGVIINEHTLTREELRRHVDTLSRWFDFIHLDDLPARLSRRGGRPFCLLTFDDGHLSNATLTAPELRRLGIPACFFLVTDFVGSGGVLWFTLYRRLRAKLRELPQGLSDRAVKQLPYDLLTDRLARACREHGIDASPSDEHDAAMTWDQARELRRQGFIVGAHGESHSVLTRETREFALSNIELSIARVSSELGEPCSTFAFPNGNYTAELAQLAAACGARYVFTAEPTWADSSSLPWRMPRVQLFGSHDVSRMELKLAASAIAGCVPSGDGTGRIYREINRLARAQAVSGAWRAGSETREPTRARPPTAS